MRPIRSGRAKKKMKMKMRKEKKKRWWWEERRRRRRRRRGGLAEDEAWWFALCFYDFCFTTPGRRWSVIGPLVECNQNSLVHNKRILDQEKNC
jgi:hypothetical protein